MLAQNDLMLGMGYLEYETYLRSELLFFQLEKTLTIPLPLNVRLLKNSIYF